MLKIIDNPVILSEKPLNPGNYRKKGRKKYASGRREASGQFSQAKIEQISNITCLTRDSVYLCLLVFAKNNGFHDGRFLKLF